MGTNISPVIARCPQLSGFRYIFGRRGMRNPAVEYNVVAFPSFPLPGKAKQRLVVRVTTMFLMSSC